MPDILIPNILLVSPRLRALCAARYTLSLREYSRQLRAHCRELNLRSRDQRAECRRLNAQSERAQAITQPVAA